MPTTRQRLEAWRTLNAYLSLVLLGSAIVLMPLVPEIAPGFVWPWVLILLSHILYEGIRHRRRLEVRRERLGRAR